MKKNNLLELLLTFMKIGFFTFGGGYAMVAIIENICVEERKWITHDDMMNVLVIAESTPGPIAINCATFVGWKQAGFPGAVAASFGVVFPSFLVIFAISQFLDNFLEITVIANAFKGIKMAVGVIVVNAAVNMIKKMHKGKLPCTVLAVSTVLMLFSELFSWNFSSVSMLLTAAVVCFLIFVVQDKMGQKGGAES